MTSMTTAAVASVVSFDVANGAARRARSRWSTVSSLERNDAVALPATSNPTQLTNTTSAHRRKIARPFVQPKR